MVHRTAVLPGYSGAKIRSVSGQLSTLKHLVKSLNVEHATKHAERLKEHVPEEYLGLVALPRLDHFGALRIPIAADAWHAASGWDIKTGIRGLAVKRMFNPDDFHMEDRTIEAFEELGRAQSVLDAHKSEHNPLRIFLVRATEETEPKLAEGEFLLDLASHIWLLSTHPDWRTAGDELLFRCYGERFKPLGLRAILVGYRHLKRAVNFSSAARTEGIVLIGKVPD